MVSIASNPRLENWTELDMDQNWTGSETKLGPLTQNLDLTDNGQIWIKRKILNLAENESRTRNRTQCSEIWI